MADDEAKAEQPEQQPPANPRRRKSLIVGGILAMAFMGFTGVDSGLRTMLTGGP